MLLNEDETGRYLHRIGLSEIRQPSLAALSELQLAHLCAVPYENTDILAGKRLPIEPRDLYEKIVQRHRGGSCLEVNGAFSLLLRSLGYDVTDLLGRFLIYDAGIPMRRHRVLLVKLEGNRYICDVSIATPAPRTPVELLPDIEQHLQYCTYKYTKDPVLGWVFNEWHESAWRALFSFTEDPQLPVDFAAPSFFCEYAPESRFNKKMMLSIRTPDGRITLEGMSLRFFKGEREFGFERELNDEAERDEILLKYFGLE